MIRYFVSYAAFYKKRQISTGNTDISIENPISNGFDIENLQKAIQSEVSKELSEVSEEMLCDAVIVLYWKRFED